MKILNKLADLAMWSVALSMLLPLSFAMPVQARDWQITNKDRYALADLSGVKRSKSDTINIDSEKTAKAIAKFQIHAPQKVVWEVLTDFQKYPEVFKRIKKCDIVKRDGDLVYIESALKPQMFVKEEKNHTINDLKGKPSILDWVLVEGSFTSCRGRWELMSANSGKDCKVTYTIIVDPGPIVPSCLTSFVLKLVQKEIISAVKHRAEILTATKSTGTESASLSPIQ